MGNPPRGSAEGLLVMSAFDPKRAFRTGQANVRFAPIADIPSGGPHCLFFAPLFDFYPREQHVGGWTGTVGGQNGRRQRINRAHCTKPEGQVIHQRNVIDIAKRESGKRAPVAADILYQRTETAGDSDIAEPGQIGTTARGRRRVFYCPNEYCA